MLWGWRSEEPARRWGPLAAVWAEPCSLQTWLGRSDGGPPLWLAPLLGLVSPSA